MHRWLVALVCFSTAMLLECSFTCRASEFKDAGLPERGDVYQFCGAVHAWLPFIAQWWHEQMAASPSRQELVGDASGDGSGDASGDASDSEGSLHASENNGASEGIAPGGCSYARLAADRRHSEGCALVLQLNLEQGGMGARAAVEERVGAGGEEPVKSLAHLPWEEPWQTRADAPSWCGCDVAWFETLNQQPLAAPATGQPEDASLAIGQRSVDPAELGAVSGDGMHERDPDHGVALLGTLSAGLWNSAVEVTRVRFASLLVLWDWLRAQPAFVRIPAALEEIMAGGRQQIPSSSYPVPSGAYLGL